MVIAIIGVLSTLLVYATGSARQKSRDNKRISDIKQIQSALDLYYTNNNSYPVAITSGQPIQDTDKVYMTTMPSNPHPDTDGNCAAGTEYSYLRVNNGANYILSYCLGSSVANVAAGTACAIQGNIGALPGTTGFFPGNTGASTQPECNSCVCGDCSALSCDGLLDFASSTASCTVGNTTYKAVKENTQCWLDKNINLGVMEPDYTDNQTDDTSIEKYCGCVGTPCLVPVENYCATDGGIYTWSEAMYLPSACNTSNSVNCAPSAYVTGAGTSSKRQGLCPKGWHIPSDYEWWLMEDFVDSGTWSDGTNYNTDQTGDSGTNGNRGTDVGTRLKCSTWDAGSGTWTGCGSSNLKFPLSGFRIQTPQFRWRGGYVYPWSTLQSGSIPANVWYHGLGSGSAQSERSGNNKVTAAPIRCLKD